MARSRSRLVLLCLVLLALTACGNLGKSSGKAAAKTPGKATTNPSTPQPADADPVLHAAFLALTTERSDLFDRRKLLRPTDEDMMPKGGTATYAGIGSVAIETPGAEFTALGNATLRANFGNGVITGSMENFIGRDASDIERAYAGSLLILGDIGAGKLKDSRFAAIVSGSLTSPDQTLVVANDLFSGFRGLDHQTLFATTDDGDRIKVDGVAVVGRVQVIAEK